MKKRLPVIVLLSLLFIGSFAVGASAQSGCVITDFAFGPCGGDDACSCYSVSYRCTSLVTELFGREAIVISDCVSEGGGATGET